MPVTNSQTGTRIDEVADRIYRISVPVPPSAALPPGFSFNQYLIAADDPLLFHTGPRRMFPLVREAMAVVLPPESLRYVGFSHATSAAPSRSGSLRRRKRRPFAARSPRWCIPATRRTAACARSAMARASSSAATE